MANLYLILLCLFNILFASGHPIARYLFVFIFGLSCFWTVKLLKGSQPLYIRRLTLLLGMFVVYGLISIFQGNRFIILMVGKEIDASIYLISILKSILPIYAIYYLFRIGKLTITSIDTWMPIFISSAIIQFVLSGLMIINSGHNATTLVNNSGYMFMSLIPLLFFIKNIKLKWLYLVIIYGFCLLSMKRGAILIGTLGIGYVVYKEIGLASRKVKFRLFYSVSILIIIIGIGFAKLYNDNEFFRYRIEATLEGNTSRRDVIYEEMYAYFLNKETIVEQLIGKGADATLTIGENYAHNDWLEILIDNGLFGILIFILYWTGFYKQVKVFKKGHYRAAFFLIFIMGLLKTFFSMYYTSIATPMAFAIGLCLCQLNKKSNNESNIYSKPRTDFRSHQSGIEYS